MGSLVRSGLRALVVLSVTALVGVLAGCGGSGTGRRPTASAIPITERDFHISAPSYLKAGGYTFRVHNEGPTDHELIMAPAPAGTLPIRPDGLTVQEEAISRLEPGSLEPGAPGAVRDLTVQLKPGRYVFFCNMEGHYMAGMHAEVVVG
jgi:hypothetical protein